MANLGGQGDRNPRPRPRNAGEGTDVARPARPALQDFAFLLEIVPDAAAITGAIERADELGVMPQEVLLAERRLSPESYVEALANSLRVPAHLKGATSGIEPLPDQPIAAPRLARCPGVVSKAAGYVVLDGTALAPAQLRSIVATAMAGGTQVALASPAALREAVLRVRGADIAHRSIEALRRKAPDLSAASQANLAQTVTLAVLAGLAAGGLALAPDAATPLLLALISLPFVAVVAVRLAALAVAAGCRLDDRRETGRSDAELPVYTLLVPLFREARVLPDLVRALNRLDYPREKLDIKLILEETDAGTRAAAEGLRLGPPFDVIVVPDRLPRTKPKALNFALAFARGSLVTVFDAEDVPEPSQLREAIAAFDAGKPELACVQARLAIDNPGDGLLARQFAIEYAALFEGLLPALVRIGVPIPLGGTSNHFRTALLRQAGAWDPWNVTEDADLGIRLARFGLETCVIGSTTSEEAPFRFGAWLRQRTRWLKGWMQTAIVHTRHPVTAMRDTGVLRALAIVTVMGGIILSALVHPLFTAILIAGAIEGAPLGVPETFIGHGLWWVALGNLAAGYASSMALALLVLVRRRSWRLIPHVLLVPLYWQLISLAAYRALWQLFREPHLWEKTEHGLGRRTPVQTTPTPQPRRP